MLFLSFFSTEMAPSAKHRKIDSEGRLFKEEWIEKYFFVEHNNNPLCLICQETVAVFKEHNIRRHYDSKHKKYSEITGQIVVKVVNLILSKGLKHRQFQQLLLEVDSQYSDLLYFCEVRWLSRGKMLERFFELLDEINIFLEMKNIDKPELRDPVWVANLAFLVDITAHLNDLNLKLQGRNQLVTDLFRYIVSFERRLDLLKGHLEQSNFKHFPTLNKLQPGDTTLYVQFMSDLKDQFSSRFEDIRSHEVELKLFATPFDVDVDSAPGDIQMELIDLQSNMVMKSKHDSKDISLLDFYQKYLIEDGAYPNLVDNAKKIVSIFGSTYICEQLFSKMKLTKSKLRTALTDSHLDGALRLSSSSLKPNIKKLVLNKRHQVSH